MEIDEIQRKIMTNTTTYESITSEKLWNRCNKPNKNKFYKILHDMLESEWITRNKEGILRADFNMQDLIPFDSVPLWLKEWCDDVLKTIKKRHNPLMKIKKDGSYSMTKSTKGDLDIYFEQCDTHTLSYFNKNFIAYRLKLITISQYEVNLEKLEKRFDYYFYNLLNDHKQFKKQLMDYYQSKIHTTKFKV